MLFFEDRLIYHVIAKAKIILDSTLVGVSCYLL